MGRCNIGIWLKTALSNLHSGLSSKESCNSILFTPYEWKALNQGEGQLTIYTEKYRQLVLELQHLHPSTKLHGFVPGLRPCIRTVVEKMCPQSCEEAMWVAEWTNGIEAHMHPMYGNRLATFNNRSWMPIKNSIGRVLTRGEVSRNQWTRNMGRSLFFIPRYDI